MLLLNELNELVIAELWVLWTGVPACKTHESIFVIKLLKANRRKEHGALDKVSKRALHLRYSCSYQVSGA